MKKAILLGLLLALLLLSACADLPRAREMYIEPAQLDAGEQALAHLLGMDSRSRIYDFQLDDRVQSIEVRSYELKDGAWAPMSGGRLAFRDGSGRLALSFDQLAEGMRVGIQSANSSGGSSFTKDLDSEIQDGMSCTTSVLSQRSALAYGEEVPLVVQILTSQNTVHSYVVEYFFQPEAYAARNYEHVYAVTVCFSEDPLQ